MSDTEQISVMTWNRNIESVNKIGYMDGSGDGQNSIFQTSFDVGYEQGFKFGMLIGLKNSLRSISEDNYVSNQISISDPRRINCQLCINGIPSAQNVMNLYNVQQEKNNILEQSQIVKCD